MTIATYPAPVQSTPGAVLGYAELAANQSGITTAVDITGLAVTVFVPAGRRLRITARGKYQNAAGAGGLFKIQEGATLLNSSTDIPTSNVIVNWATEAIISPTAGVHTYKVTAANYGGGTVGLFVGGDYGVTFLMVEDITGGTGGPGPIQLANAVLSTDQTGISAGMTPITNLSATVAIPAGRRIRLTFHAEIAYSDATTAFFFEAFQNGVDVGRFAMTSRLTVGDFIIVEGTVILSPAVAGVYTFDVRAQRYVGAGTLTVYGTVIPGAFLSVEDITGTPSPAGILPTSQTLAYVEKTTTQAYTVANTVITGLSATVTVPAGRRIKVRAYSHMQHSVANGGAGLRILEDGVSKNEYWAYGPVAGSGFNVDVEAILSPTAGVHTYTVQGGIVGGGTVTQYAAVGIPAYLIVEDITGGAPAVPPANVPVGVLAQASNFGSGVTSTVTDALVALSTLNVVVPAGRVVRLVGKAHISSSVAAERTRIVVREGGTILAAAYRVLSGGSLGEEAIVIATVSPSAGAHTYEFAFARNTGSGTHTIYSNATEPTIFTVEDITPTPAPANTAPSSTLGYAESRSAQTGITTEVDLTGLTVTVTVPDGRRLRITGSVAIRSNTLGQGAQVRIRQDGSEIQYMPMMPVVVDNSEVLQRSVVVTPAAGTHTYKLTALRTGASNTVAVDAYSTDPNWLLVEDITATAVIVPVNTVTDFFFTVGLNSGGATTMTEFLAQNNVGSLPYNYSMVVTAYILHGFNGVSNVLRLRVLDEAGANINWKGAVLGGSEWGDINQTSPQVYNSTILGKKDYAAGATCGFRLAYLVNTSNVWMDVGIHVRLVPR